LNRVSTETVYLLLPELILVLFATAIYLGGACTPAREGWSWLAAAALVLAATALYQQQEDPLVSAAVAQAAAGVQSGPVTVDLFGQSLRWMILGTGLIFVLISSRSAFWGLAPESMGSLLLIIAGLMLAAVANDLVLMFLGLELVSIPTYVVLYLGRSDADSQEAATKYFFLSVLSSALLLYGFSFLYGAAGSTQLAQIHSALSRPSSEAVLQFKNFSKLAMVLIVAGLGFRITAVPFHFYAPDVYQGTSQPNAGLLAVVPKIAGFVALVRVAAVAMPGQEHFGWKLALWLAIATMTLGNLLGLWQQNIRRLLAYSSIAHAGYMLIGLAMALAVAGGAETAANVDGLGALLFYLLVYALATAGAFAALTYLGSQSRQIDGVDDLAGLGRSHPLSAAAIAVCMFSLTGLPPFAGFWGKFGLLTGALGVDARSTQINNLWPWFVGLAVVGVLNAAISAAYYLRIIGAMYFRPSLVPPPSEGGIGAGLAAFLCSVLVLGIGLFPGPLMQRANDAGRSARGTYESRPEPSDLGLPRPTGSPIAKTPAPRIR